MTRYVDIYSAGSHPGPGYYECLRCGGFLLSEGGGLPRCAACGSTAFARTSFRDPEGRLHVGVRFDERGGYEELPLFEEPPVDQGRHGPPKINGR